MDAKKYARSLGGFRRIVFVIRSICSICIIFFQITLARSGQLLPSQRHLLELRTMRGRRGARHLAALGSVLKILMHFLHDVFPPPAK